MVREGGVGREGGCWTFTPHNQSAIMAHQRVSIGVLVWFPGAICKAAEQEIRSFAAVPQSLEGAPGPSITWGGGYGGRDGAEIVMIDRDVAGRKPS